MHPSNSAASLAVLALAALTTGYALLCAVSPWGRCRKCHGKGRRLGTPYGRLTRIWCRRCHGTGIRLRIGRRLWNRANREYRDGAR
jgi:DnaJ-class molecular chaperone